MPNAKVTSSDDEENGRLLSQHNSTTERPSPLSSICVAVAYGCASVVTTLANKALLTSWGFDVIFSLIFLQNLLTVIVGFAMQQYLLPSGRRVASADWTTAFAFPLFDRGLAMSVLPACLVCVANLWCGMSALSLSSVPVYQTLKRMTPLPAMALDALLRGKRFSPTVCASVFVVCLGAFLTGCGDLDRNTFGYLFAMSSCVLQALYLVLAAKAADTQARLSSLCVNHYNALCSLPFLAVGVILEYDRLASFASWSNAQFWSMLVLDLVLGAALSLLLFMCTLTNSALTTTLVGNAKAILTTALGAIIFGRGGLRPVGWLGIFVNTLGGVMYSAVKLRAPKGGNGSTATP